MSDELSSSTSPIDLGPGWEVTPLAPGRFSNRIQKHTTRTHAFQVIREQTTSSFVLNLELDGTVTVCRGYQYSLFNDGPEVHTAEHIREQRGYRGRWEHRHGWAHLDLVLDDGVCPRVEQSGRGRPSEPREWHLRCLPLVPGTGATLTTPILACQSVDVEPVFSEDAPHAVRGILPGGWIVLGAGNGLKINEEPTAIGGELPTLRVELSPEPVGAGAWEHPF